LSILKKKAALVTVGALFAFQALAVIGATSALAAPTCVWTAGVWNITLDGGGDDVWINRDSADVMTPEVTDNGVGAVVCTGQIGPSSTVSATTAVNITAGAGDQWAGIDLSDDASNTRSWGTINWTINLGSGTGDVLDFADNSDAATGDLDIVLGANGIDLNNDGDLDVTVAGTEFYAAYLGGGDDTVSGAGSTATGGPFTGNIEEDTLGFFAGYGGLFSGDGDDTLLGGSGRDELWGEADDDVVGGALGDDLLDGGSEIDAVDYSASATAVNVNLVAGIASGEGVDTLANFENIIGSAFGDTLRGADGADNQITPGAGDDSVNGGTGVDTVDYRDAAAAVTVDIDLGTSTGGSGTDTLTSIENARGSAFDDVLIGDDGDNRLRGSGGNDTLAGGYNADDGNPGDTLEGEAGVDTADYSAYEDALTLVLNHAAIDGTGDYGYDTDVIRTMENAILTTEDDSFTGNEFANKVWPFGGQNSLAGDAAGAADTGGDVLDYSQGYDAGVEVNMAGGATAGDSALGFESVIGTSFADNFTGNGASNTMKGRAGDDVFRGGSGDDDIKGAKGNDVMRGGSGDDNLFGGKGKKDMAWGGSGDDYCKSVKPQYQHSCEA